MIFVIEDSYMMKIKLLENLKYIHFKNYILRDIKPHNFLVSPNDEGQMYLIAFDLAEKYRSNPENHAKFAIDKHIAGISRFCPINAMKRVEQNKRNPLGDYLRKN